MVQPAAGFLITTIAEASRILDLDALDVLIMTSLMAAEGRATVSGLAAGLNLPRETCRRRLAALRAAGWVHSERLALPTKGTCTHAARIEECLAMLDSQSRRFAAAAMAHAQS